jgi:ABC-type branched-subunit amino acid transport system substrate-binding protein
MLRNNESELDGMLNEKEFEDMDLIISPLFDNLYKKVSELAWKQKINMINPVAIDKKFLLNNFTYLYQPTTETQAHRTIDFAFQNFKNKTVLILHDNLPRNKNFAIVCKQYAENLGLKVLGMEEFQAGNLVKIESFLSKFNPTEVGSLVAITTSQLITLDIIKVLKNKIYDVPVFAPDAWLTFQEIDFADYEKLNVHFIYPEFLNTDTPEALRFKKAYLEFARQEPSTYSYVGYDIIHYFAALLNQYGTKTDYRRFLKNAKPTKGKIDTVIDYSKANDNQFVPILKIVQGVPELINR